MSTGSTSGDGQEPAESTVMGSIDRSRGVDSFIVADISVDDAWLSVPEHLARSLEASR